MNDLTWTTWADGFRVAGEQKGRVTFFVLPVAGRGDNSGQAGW
jgi:hypothetical protein